MIGQTSGTVAYVKRIRLITDNYGDVEGSFFIRDPFENPTPERLATGTKPYRLSSSKTNDEGLPEVINFICRIKLYCQCNYFTIQSNSNKCNNKNKH